MHRQTDLSHDTDCSLLFNLSDVSPIYVIVNYDCLTPGHAFLMFRLYVEGTTPTSRRFLVPTFDDDGCPPYEHGGIYFCDYFVVS
jgi:hypothetical protein